MDGDQKIIIFAKKEVSLIFICMLLISFLSFLMGVKIGKKYSITKEGISKEDVREVDLRMQLESDMQKKPVESPTTEAPSKEMDESTKKLSEEFASLASEGEKAERVPSSSSPIIEEAPKSEYSGKYTIQLGSYRSYNDAEKFADGFRIRGYEPIIQEIEVKGKGMVYRVSTGVFENQNEANEYTLSEKSLFQGQEFIIVKFD